MDILRENGIDWKERMLIRKLYSDQNTVLRLGSEMMKKFKIGKDVTQAVVCLPQSLICIFKK